MRTRARERKRERERSKRKSARPHDDDTDENNASLAFICEPRARARREQQNGRERCGYKVVRICFDMTDKVSGVKLFFFPRVNAVVCVRAWCFCVFHLAISCKLI